MGTTYAAIKEMLTEAVLDDSPRVREELSTYLASDLGRFLLTLESVPDGTGRLLEIGASPYFTTLLLQRYRRYDLALTNHFGPGAQDGRAVAPGLPYASLNIETDALPYDDGSFDVVLFCEVLEHLVNDPMAAMARINTLLRDGGTLVLTTPNAARLANVRDVLAGRSVHDAYSAYGPYGRHNREYTADEIRLLLEAAGFRVVEMFTADTLIPGTARSLGQRMRRFVASLARLAPRRGGAMGSYIFARAEKIGAPSDMHPGWLYRSYE